MPGRACEEGLPAAGEEGGVRSGGACGRGREVGMGRPGREEGPEAGAPGVWTE